MALSQARAVSDDANADESRYLVDPIPAAAAVLIAGLAVAGVRPRLAEYK